eukprot:COSAG02_NODE_31070_length_539_cov_32.436364_1_plen_80_part_00
MLMESFCSAALLGGSRRESSIWALRHRDMLHDIAEAAAASRDRQKGRFVADKFSAGNLSAGNICHLLATTEAISYSEPR